MRARMVSQAPNTPKGVPRLQKEVLATTPGEQEMTHIQKKRLSLAKRIFNIGKKAHRERCIELCQECPNRTWGNSDDPTKTAFIEIANWVMLHEYRPNKNPRAARHL